MRRNPAENMVDEARIRSFLFIYLKEHLRGIPQSQAMDAIGYDTFEAIADGRIDRFSIVNLVRILNDLGADQQEVLESARFHTSLKRN